MKIENVKCRTLKRPHCEFNYIFIIFLFFLFHAISVTDGTSNMTFKKKKFKCKPLKEKDV